MNGAGSPQKNEMTGAPASSATSTRSSWGSSDRSMMMFTPNGRSVIARISSIAARISSGSIQVIAIMPEAAGVRDRCREGRHGQAADRRLDDRVLDPEQPRDRRLHRAQPPAPVAASAARSMKICSPVEQLRRRGPTGTGSRARGGPCRPVGCEAGERPTVGRLEDDRLEHALRPDHDVRQREPVVRKRREQLRVERAGALVALPAQPRPDDLVDALGREGRDQPVDVAPVLGDRVALPQPPDPPMRRGIGRPPQPRRMLRDPRCRHPSIVTTARSERSRAR